MENIPFDIFKYIIARMLNIDDVCSLSQSINRTDLLILECERRNFEINLSNAIEHGFVNITKYLLKDYPDINKTFHKSIHKDKKLLHDDLISLFESISKEDDKIIYTGLDYESNDGNHRWMKYINQSILLYSCRHFLNWQNIEMPRRRTDKQYDELNIKRQRKGLKKIKLPNYERTNLIEPIRDETYLDNRYTIFEILLQQPDIDVNQWLTLFARHECTPDDEKCI